ncbi:MAG: hypothetical protein IPJ85_02885 [Flavobacteriales bacterium]|nr:hypothetical protein [Flavobacteriales bacterium]
MKQLLRFGWMMAASLLLLLPFGLKAQSGNPNTGHYAVRVIGLTAADRDALQQDLKGRNDLKLVFACIPAGVLVFASQAESKQVVEQRALPLLEAKAHRSRIEELTGGLADAEDACTQARNR